MSGNLSTGPLPVPLGAMRCNDQDSAFDISAAAFVQARGTTLATIDAPIISRQDGAAVGSGDLTVAGVTVSGDGLSFTFAAQTHGNVAVYYIAFPLHLANGDDLTRDFEIRSLLRLG